MLFMSGYSLFATHNRAGEISYTHVSGLTYRFTITTYTYTPSPADRPEIEILWGDGKSSVIPRYEKINLGNNISKNLYYANHTYSSSGTYSITFEDPNRNAGVVNIPNSVDIPFFIETILIINPFLGNNSSPILLNPPIDNGCVNVPFYHNPGAYDPDGDSLVFQLINCRGFEGEVIPGYTIPQASNYISIHSVTGELTWDSPQVVGEYNIAILITEYRNGIKIGSMVRDMQISIVACNNRPPEIHCIDDTCVVAGSLLEIPMLITDPNSTEVILTATGEPLIITNSPATVYVAGKTPPFDAQFRWQTNCGHVKKGKYIVYFKATDNGPVIPLSSFKTLYITVIAPAPENLTATPAGNTMHLSWNRAICTNAVGYKVYKRRNSNPFTPEYCETGMPKHAGYTLIGTTNRVTDTAFIDNGAVMPIYHGNEYCYRVVAFFGDNAESYVSEEVCAYIVDDAPLITHVDIETTSTELGSIHVRWLHPDTLTKSGPYMYHVLRASTRNANFSTMGMVDFDDELYFFDENLNTENEKYTYKVELWSMENYEPEFVEVADPASSIFLSIVPTDKQLKLSWLEETPWDNRRYIIYRYNNETTDFDSIGEAFDRQYVDYNLVNGVEYCYYILSEGGYFRSSDTIFPLYNRSQQVCAVPIDNIPPDVPTVEITTDCEIVTLQWVFPSDTSYLDVYKYYFLYRPDYNSSMKIIDSIYSDGSQCYAAPCQYIFDALPSMIGCYALAAIDSAGNLSPQTPEVCFDSDQCVTYTLPNIFTPNNDGYNDFWIPFPYKNVQKIDLSVYDRWGRKVFTTNNPDIRWDGYDILTKQPLPEGNYYYACDVYLYSLSGIKKKFLTGIVMLVRSNNQGIKDKDRP